MKSVRLIGYEVWWETFAETICFSLEWNSKGIMDGKSGDEAYCTSRDVICRGEQGTVALN